MQNYRDQIAVHSYADGYNVNLRICINVIPAQAPPGNQAHISRMKNTTGFLCAPVLDCCDPRMRKLFCLAMSIAAVMSSTSEHILARTQIKLLS